MSIYQGACTYTLGLLDLGKELLNLEEKIKMSNRHMEQERQLVIVYGSWWRGLGGGFNLPRWDRNAVEGGCPKEKTVAEKKLTAI